VRSSWWGVGSQPSPSARGCGKRCKLSQLDRGATSEHFKNFWPENVNARMSHCIIFYSAKFFSQPFRDTEPANPLPVNMVPMYLHANRNITMSQTHVNRMQGPNFQKILGKILSLA